MINITNNHTETYQVLLNVIDWLSPYDLITAAKVSRAWKKNLTPVLEAQRGLSFAWMQPKHSFMLLSSPVNHEKPALFSVNQEKLFIAGKSGNISIKTLNGESFIDFTYPIHENKITELHTAGASSPGQEFVTLGSSDPSIDRLTATFTRINNTLQKYQSWNIHEFYGESGTVLYEKNLLYCADTGRPRHPLFCYDLNRLSEISHYRTSRLLCESITKIATPNELQDLYYLDDSGRLFHLDTRNHISDFKKKDVPHFLNPQSLIADERKIITVNREGYSFFDLRMNRIAFSCLRYPEPITSFDYSPMIEKVAMTTEGGSLILRDIEVRRSNRIARKKFHKPSRRILRGNKMLTPMSTHFHHQANALYTLTKEGYLFASSPFSGQD